MPSKCLSLARHRVGAMNLLAQRTSDLHLNPPALATNPPALTPIAPAASLAASHLAPAQSRPDA